MKSTTTGRTLLSIALTTTFALTGCADRDLRPLAPCTVRGVVSRVKIFNVDAIDLLFVIDNSASMAEEQAALQAEIPRLVQVLASGDRNDNGTFDEGIDFPPPRSLHVGVITTDMGLGAGSTFEGASVCQGSGRWGDDGELQLASGVAGDEACSVPAFLAFEPATGEVRDAVDHVRCVADVGVAGCALEQPLEAMLKAITPADSEFRFVQREGPTLVESTRGQAGSDTPGIAPGANAGFFRPDALLAVVMVTDEDDCSSPNTQLYDVLAEGADAPYPVPRVEGRRAPQLQCSAHRDAQYDVQRYVQGLMATRLDPSLVLFAMIAGVAPAVVDEAEVSADFYGTILDHPSMAEVVDPSTIAAPAQPDLTPSCTRPNPLDPNTPNLAFPPRRLVELARAVEENEGIGVVTSICNARDPDGGDFSADFQPAIDRIIERIADSFSAQCVRRELRRDGLGRVGCDVVETLPVGVACASRAESGRTFLRVEPGEDGEVGTADDRESCSVPQLVPTAAERAAREAPAGVGWFYDDYTPQVVVEGACTTQRVAFTTEAEPVSGTIVRLECLEAVPSGGDERIDIGSTCPASCERSGADLDALRSQYGRPNAQLRCVAAINTCQLACETDADCPGAYTCLGTDQQTGADPFAFCVNPTCPL